MTEAGFDQPARDAAEELAEAVADLDVPEGVDVSGGSLNAYTAKPVGEKQGKP